MQLLNVTDGLFPFFFHQATTNERVNAVAQRQQSHTTHTSKQSTMADVEIQVESDEENQVAGTVEESESVEMKVSDRDLATEVDEENQVAERVVETSEKAETNESDAIGGAENSHQSSKDAAATVTSNDNEGQRNGNSPPQQPPPKPNDNAEQFPTPCYCPITKNVMIDPVVHPSGISFEKTAVMKRNSSLKYYPNRALRAYIQQRQEVTRSDDGGSFRGTLRHSDETFRAQGSQNIGDESALSSEECRPLPGTYHERCKLLYRVQFYESL